MNTDWDGNELLLSDILGTDGDLVMRPIEADVDRQLLRQAMDRLEPRERQIITMRFGLDGRPERTQKEVGGPAGHLTVLYLTAGEADHRPAEEGDRPHDVRANCTEAGCLSLTIFINCEKTSGKSRRDVV